MNKSDIYSVLSFSPDMEKAKDRIRKYLDNKGFQKTCVTKALNSLVKIRPNSGSLNDQTFESYIYYSLSLSAQA